MFELAELEAGLAGTIFASKLHYSAVTDSTNSNAMESARRGAPHGSAYLADEQRAGRGRGENAWHSAAGEGLYVSVLLRPEIPAGRLPLLPLAAGLAATDTVRAISGLAADLRWPNDILIGPRKAGGILVEAQTKGRIVSYAVIGIGINVHQRQFPPDLATPATSLDMAAGRHISRQALLTALLKSLEREAIALESPAACAAIPERLSRASTWIRGRTVEVHGPQACTGSTAGLDENGFLRVKTDAGIVTVQTGGIRDAASF